MSLDELRYVADRWRMDYNRYRPHISLDYVTPAGFAELCRRADCIRPYTPVLDGVQDCGILIVGTGPIKGDRSVVNDKNLSR